MHVLHTFYMYSETAACTVQKLLLAALLMPPYVISPLSSVLGMQMEPFKACLTAEVEWLKPAADPVQNPPPASVPPPAASVQAPPPAVNGAQMEAAMRALSAFPGLPVRPEMLMQAIAKQGSPCQVTSPHQSSSPHISNTTGVSHPTILQALQAGKQRVATCLQPLAVHSWTTVSLLLHS